MLKKYCFILSGWNIFAFTFYLIMQRPAESGRFIAKKKSCTFDPSRFRWLPIAVYRRDNTFILEMEKQSKKQSYGYYPNYGYEPYWADGNWVLDMNKTTPTGDDYACGEFCHDMYYDFGPVCGRGRNYTHKTFDTYCQLQNEDCKGREKWMIAYRGPCQDELKTRPTNQSQLIARAKQYLTEFEENNPSTVPLLLFSVTRRDPAATTRLTTTKKKKKNYRLFF